MLKHSAPPKAERHRQAGQKALQARQWPQAVQEFGHATRLAPHDALLWLSLARAHLAAGALRPATEAATRAVKADPRSPLAARMLAACLIEQGRFADAAAAFDALPASVARDLAWHTEQADALYQAKRLQESVSAYFQALTLKLDDPALHYRLGLCFKDLGMNSEATECLRTAAALGNPLMQTLTLSLLVHEGRQACDWRHVAEDTQRLLAALDQTRDDSGHLLSPFALLVEATPAQQRRIGALRTQGLTRQIKPLPAPGPRRPGPIRLGYLSCDLHQHATAVLLAEVLEQRDRSRFEVSLYSHSPDDGTATCRRVRAACEHFVDVSHMTNAEAAQRMRADGIDIAIDLKGHTRGSRFELLAYRPAPLQVAYLGYPASTGAPFIDYLIGDPVVLPLAHAANYSEHIAQLPHSYQPNDQHRALPPVPPRSTLGLPEHAVVLCCFNQSYKLSPHMLDLWARILHAAPQAVLWMLAWNPHAQSRLNDELAQRGIPAARVFWAPKLGLADHIARLRAADLFLDTWPCNAHTTASEALWAGVPVLTVPGATYASRVAASLVHACGLPDLACADEDHYVTLATGLAQEPATLAGLKQHLNSQRMSLPLFDSARYVRDYEALLQRMFERQQAGLPPAAMPAQASA